jgi:general stress protein CsbA
MGVLEMKLNLKLNISGYLHQAITINLYGFILAIISYLASIKISKINVTWIIIIILVSINCVYLIALQRLKNNISFTKDKIIIKSNEINDSILFSNIEKVVFRKTKWYYYLLSDYFAGDFIIYFKDDKNYNKKIYLTNSQFKKVKNFINQNVGDVIIKNI